MSAPTGTRTLVAYGHSWVFGTGATRRDRGFAALAARALDLRHDDRAESGSLSGETARLVLSCPPPVAALNVLMTGLNDARLNGSTPEAREAYADALSLIFRALRRADPAAPVLALEQPYMFHYAGCAPFHRASNGAIDSYNATLRQVASHFGVHVVVITGWNVDTMISDDGVHPGDTGHRHLAQAVVRASLQSLRFTDQKAAPTSAASAPRSARRIAT